MATETGTATGFLDLYTKLVTFATTALGADNWSLAHGYEHEDSTIDATPIMGNQNAYENKVILRGPGSGGGDEIFVGFTTNQDSDTQQYTISVQGFNAYDSNKPYSDQLTVSQPCFSYFWDQTMAYWFIGSGRRLIAVARMGSVYQILYAGFMLPYATPVDYPYPLLLGGCGNVVTNTFASTAGNDFFCTGGRNGSGSLYTPANTFVTTGNYNSEGGWVGASGAATTTDSLYFLPYSAGRDYNNRLNWIREALDGCYVLTPIEILGNGQHNMRGIIGLVDGIYQVSGFGNYSENVVTVGGTDYLVIQRVYRASVDSFVALRWE